MIRQAVISAGGSGTRLRPMTDAMPKPMIPILGKPMLEWHVEQFKKFGVSEFFFTLGYLPEVVTGYFGDGARFGVKINYLIEQTPLGSAGGVKQLAPQLDQLFFFIYGDTFSLMDYGKMEAAYAGKKIRSACSAWKGPTIMPMQTLRNSMLMGGWSPFTPSRITENITTHTGCADHSF